MDLVFFVTTAVGSLASSGFGERLHSLCADWSLSLASDKSSSPNRKPVMIVFCIFTDCGDVDVNAEVMVIREHAWKKNVDVSSKS